MLILCCPVIRSSILINCLFWFNLISVYLIGLCSNKIKGICLIGYDQKTTGNTNFDRTSAASKRSRRNTGLDQSVCQSDTF